MTADGSHCGAAGLTPGAAFVRELGVGVMAQTSHRLTSNSASCACALSGFCFSLSFFFFFFGAVLGGFACVEKREAVVFASFCLKSGDDRGLRLLYRAAQILLPISSRPQTNNTSHFGQSLLSSWFNVTAHKVGYTVSCVYTTYVDLPASSLCKLDKACEHDCANHHGGA